MAHHSYRTSGTCSVMIDFDLDGEKRLHDVKFLSGCNGNLRAIGRLVEGKDAKEVADLLKGIRCGFKQTSCGDQLALAIEQALTKEALSA